MHPYMSDANTSRCEVVVYGRDTASGEPSVRTVIREAALVIGVNGKSDYAIMRTPGHDRELAVGFLFTEGMINGVGDLTMLTQCQDTPDSLIVRTVDEAAQVVSRNLVVNSSCGLCGRADIDELVKGLPTVSSDVHLDPKILNDLPSAVRAAQTLFDSTGATHAAALFDIQGQVLVVREDVGRHNAVDKVIGYALMARQPLHSLGLFLSGRTSLELIVKAARAKISIVVSVSAPTDAAVTVAERLGIAVVGFARGTGFTVYTHANRLQ